MRGQGSSCLCSALTERSNKKHNCWCTAWAVTAHTFFIVVQSQNVKSGYWFRSVILLFITHSMDSLQCIWNQKSMFSLQIYLLKYTLLSHNCKFSPAQVSVSIGTHHCNLLFVYPSIENWQHFCKRKVVIKCITKRGAFRIYFTSTDLGIPIG